MKKLIALFLIGLTLCDYDYAHHKKIVDYVNSLHTTWTAKVSGLDIKPLIGTIPTEKGKDELDILELLVEHMNRKSMGQIINKLLLKFNIYSFEFNK